MAPSPPRSESPSSPGSPSGAAFTIETPHLEDADACARVHVNGWRDAYSELLEDHERWFGAPALERRTAQWTSILTPGSPDHGLATIQVGRDREGQVIGFATAGETRDPEAGPDLELFALYIDRAWYGTGLGRALTEAVLDGAPASVWVAKETRGRAASTRNSASGPTAPSRSRSTSRTCRTSAWCGEDAVVPRPPGRSQTPVGAMAQRDRPVD